MYKSKKRFYVDIFFLCVLFEYKIYFYIEICFFFMEVKYCFFDMDIFKIVLYLNSLDLIMLLWMYWYYFFDIIFQGNQMIVQFYLRIEFIIIEFGYMIWFRQDLILKVIVVLEKNVGLLKG